MASVLTGLMQQGRPLVCPNYGSAASRNKGMAVAIPIFWYLICPWATPLTLRKTFTLAKHYGSLWDKFPG